VAYSFRTFIGVGCIALFFLTMCRSPQPLQIAPPHAVQSDQHNSASSDNNAARPQIPIQPTVTKAASRENGPTAIAQPLQGNVQPIALSIEQKVLSGQIDSYLNSLVEGRLFHGSVLVAQKGQIILSKGYGLANYTSGVPNEPSTRFRIASLTKQFTALAIMQLQVAGKLSTNDPICNYLDSCPDHWRGVTIHHALTHTSGIPSYTELLDYEATQMYPATPQQLLSRVSGMPLLFEPGSNYLYGNTGYVILGLIIERVSGKSYADYLQEAIFNPLQMSNTGIDTSDSSFAGQAAGYSTFDQQALFLDASTLFACGSLYSSVEDLYRWDQALYSDILLPAEARAQLFTPFLYDYAYGWKVTRPDGHLLINHSGLIDGFSTYISRYPEDDLTVIVLANMHTADSVGIGKYIASMVLDRE
jgi:CubicO group peptidase (beta-lactamase class C family)